MKILFVHNRYRYQGGEERVVGALGQLLGDRGHQIQRFERDSLEWANHSWWQHSGDALDVVYSKHTADDFERTAHSFQPDIVHVHNVFPVISPSIYLRGRKLGLPIVQTVHNYRFLCANGLFLTPENQICERCKKGAFWSAVRFGCCGGNRLQSLAMAVSLTVHRYFQTFQKCIHAFIAPSHFLRDKLIEAGFPSNRIFVVANPEQGFPVLEKPSARLSFVYAGRLSSEKGLWTLLRAFEPHPDWKLTILGDGPLYSPLKRHLEDRKLTHIELLGKVPNEEVHRRLAKASCLILPSECYENLPYVVLEAWSHGTPVIASKIGGLAELVKEGENGWSFVAGDPADLGRVIDRVSQSLLRMDGIQERCQQLLKRVYHPDVIYPQLLSVYESVLRSTPVTHG